MSKTAILPIVTVICLAIGTISGHPIGADIQDMIATIASTIILAGVSVYGVIKDHKKLQK